MGRGMIILACILAMGMLTMFFSNMEERQRADRFTPISEVSGDSIQVQLRRNRGGHYVSKGYINRREVEFLLDTGATDVVVPSLLAEQLSLRQGRPQTAMTANGAVTVFDTVIDELTIGEITLYNVPASINPGMKPPGILLGMSALGQIEFTQQGDLLTLKKRI